MNMEFKVGYSGNIHDLYKGTKQVLKNIEEEKEQKRIKNRSQMYKDLIKQQQKIAVRYNSNLHIGQSPYLETRTSFNKNHSEFEQITYDGQNTANQTSIVKGKSSSIKDNSRTTLDQQSRILAEAKEKYLNKTSWKPQSAYLN